jgi:DNA-binding transcriptional LysR family regulator
VDLNLIRVLVAVYETRGTTAAARRLYVTPPAISQSLTRLRREVEDPLFVREGNTMQPTPVAHSLYAQWSQALVNVDRSIDAARNFDPAETRRHVRIGMTELGEVGWLPDVLRVLRAAAPGVSVSVLPVEPESLQEWLSKGQVDLAISPTLLPRSFEGDVIKSQPYSVIGSSDHALASRALTVETYAQAEHLQVAGDLGREHLDAVHRRAGLEIEARVVVHRVAAVPPTLVANPDLLAVVPESIARGWAEAWPLKVWELPLAMEPVVVRLYKQQTSQHSTFLDWLHATVLRAVSGTQGHFEAINAGG